MAKTIAIRITLVLSIILSLTGCPDLLKQIAEIVTTPTTIEISGTVSLSQNVTAGHFVWIGLLKTAPISAPSSVTTWVKYRQLTIAPGASTIYSFSDVEAGKYVVVAFYDLNDNASYEATEPFGGFPAPNGYPLYDFSSDTVDENVTISAVGATPIIGLSVPSLSFFAAAGGSNPSAQTVSVTNTGGGSLSGLSASVSYGGIASGWLSAGLSATTGPATLTVQASTSSLSAGTYTATVAISSSVSGVEVKNLDVSCSVSSQGQAPVLWLSSSSLSFSTAVGGANPSAQTVSVSNAGGGTLSGLSASVSYGGSASGWLSATLSATAAPATLTVQPSTGSLVVGTYTATVSVASSVSGIAAQNVTVSFVVSQTPVIGLSTRSLSFYTTTGGANPSPGAVLVFNSGGGTLSGLSASVSYPQGQPSGWLNASVPGTAPGALAVQATTGSLAAGSYTATVSVGSSMAGVSAQSVSVTFTITAQTTSPSIGLSSTSLNFFAAEAGASPEAQIVTVSNAGGGTLSELGASVSYASGSGWLTAELNATTSPATLTVQATTGSLTAGSYTATVAIASGVAGNSPQNVSITFSVSPPPPVIGLSVASLSYSAVAGEASPSEQTVTVSNAGGGVLSGLSASVSYGSGSGWLSATLDSTTALTTLRVQPSTGSLAAGSYMATVTVSSSVAGTASQTVSVSFSVAEGPKIGLTSSSLSFYATQGGGNPNSQSVVVLNAGGGVLSGMSVTVIYATGSGWLTASLSGATAPAAVTVQPITGSLAAGSYAATIRISGVASNTPQSLSVSFAIAEQVQPPAIGVSPSSLSFSATAGGANPSAQAVSVSNAGGGSLTGLSASVSYTSGSGWLTAGLNDTAAPATLTVQASTGSLSAGTFNATVTISSNISGVSSQAVSVSFVVSPPPPAIGLSQTSLSFAATAGGANPSAQTVLVTNAGGGVLSGLSAGVSYSGTGGWLSAAVNPTTAPATLTVQPSTGSLAAGTYSATVTVSSSVAASQIVSVHFTVSQYQLTVNASSGGTTSPSGTVMVNHGAATSISATANSGYSFVNWTVVSGTGVSFVNENSASTTVTLTGGNATIRANFLHAALLYTANYGSSNVSGFTVAPSGNLMPITGSPFGVGSGPNGIAAHPSGKFLYVTSASANNVSAYAIDSAGVLTATGSTLPAGSNPTGAVVHPSGNFLYVSNGASAGSAYAINSTTGELTSIGSFSAGAYPYSVGVDPTGKFLYVPNYNGSSVSAFTINTSTGELTPIGSFSTGANPTSVAADPSGKFLYVANQGANYVTAYTINSTTGALGMVGSKAAGTAPVGVAVDPTGKFLYVTNGNSANVSAYTIDSITGVLTTVGNYSTGATPWGVAVNPSGKNLYVGNYGSAYVSVFAINTTTGALAPMGNASTGGSSTHWIAIAQPQ